jgi:hypothetical protein
MNTLAITGANAGDFAIAANTCQVPGVLQPGSSCSVLISFTPSAAGSLAAALTITDNASPSTQSAQLSGAKAQQLAGSISPSICDKPRLLHHPKLAATRPAQPSLPRAAHRLPIYLHPVPARS